MTHGHWFWWLLTGTCLVWYSTITVYVAVRGAMDIKHMLKRLGDKKAEGGAGEGSES